MHLSKCNRAIQEVKDRKHPLRCGFEGLDLVPFVCCPVSDDIKARLSEESKCTNT